MIEKYSDYKKFGERFNQKAQLKLALINPNYVSCNEYKIPCLSTISAAYGADAAINWLKIQFENLNDFVGIKEKMQIWQLEELSILFFSECYFLNIAEIMLFLIKLKRGEFGEFYGYIDPLKIMSAKNEFIIQRRLALQKHDEEKEKEKKKEMIRKWNEEGITYEEFLKLNNKI